MHEIYRSIDRERPESEKGVVYFNFNFFKIRE